MSTLFALYNAAGCVGTCDARCYNAATHDCHCICCGENHGKGFAAAHLHTTAHASRLALAFARAHPEQDVLTIRIGKTKRNIRQTELFTT